MCRMWKAETIICLCAGLFIMSSCGNGSKKEKPSASDTSAFAHDRTPVSHSPEVQQIFKSPAFIKWKANIKEKYPHFSDSQFQPSDTQAINATTATQYSTEKWQHFQPYFIYSPNQRKAIDLYSYGNMPPDSTGGLPERGSPDSKINLVNMRQKTKIPLLFAGPGTIFQQAGWLNDSIVFIIGESDANEQNRMAPTLWKINILDGALTEFVYRDTIAVAPF